ncbi:MAG: hypothetical protein JO202_17670 [Ktedonobacteraceae bacterium]|nr:hypothetical protein [Ktedonobacteraceae bacterium]
MNFVVVFEHSPEFCPHSNAMARKQFQKVTTELPEMAKAKGIEIVFAGIPVPEHKCFIVLKAPTFETARSLFVDSGIVQTNTVKIYVTESFEEFAEEIKGTTPIF